MLNQSKISKQRQRLWYQYISTTKSEMHFVIEFRKEPVGLANVKTFKGDEFGSADELESGIYLADGRYRGTFLAFCPALTLNDYCFDTLSCKALIARVLPHNDAALRFNKTLGYTEIERTEVVRMRLSRTAYIEASKPIRRLIRF